MVIRVVETKSYDLTEKEVKLILEALASFGCDDQEVFEYDMDEFEPFVEELEAKFEAKEETEKEGS